MAVIRSRDNPKVRRWQRLCRDPRARRDEGRALIEGPNLLEAWTRLRGSPVTVMVDEVAWEDAGTRELLHRLGLDPVLVAEAVMRTITDVRTPQGIAAEIVLPGAGGSLEEAALCVFLDGVQDAGNLGTILRSACAFGVSHVVAGPGCADPWSPKVLRAGAGAHASLEIFETGDLAGALHRFGGRVLCTAPDGGVPLHAADLSGRIGWMFGAEGQGVQPGLVALAAASVSIPMTAGTESLNVASSAAICLYETRRRAAQ